MHKRPSAASLLLGLIVAGYLLAATLYAVYTPAWQVPDEPAHYNYVRFLVEERRFPVLAAGDYPHDYLEQIKARRFPPDMSIAPIRYEFHQPPLYYILAAGVYALVAGAGLATQVVALRLLSVFIGVWLLPVTYAIVLQVLPGRRDLALGAAAFVAFIPMHLTFSAGINNDGLAELLMAVALLLLLRHLSWRARSAAPAPAGRLLGLGLVMGLLMLTKSSVYLALPLVCLGLTWSEWRAGRLPAALRANALVFGPALLLATPWFMRNSLTYGGLDLLGLGRHDAVVVGQLRTADWLAQLGPRAAASAFLRTTFQSFWAQFGWMGVPIDSRLYVLLGLCSALLALGALLAGWRLWRGRQGLTATQWAGLALLALLLLFTVASYAWYNLQFVQPQGRYLFRGLIPLGLLAAAGLRRLLTRRGAWTAASALAGVCLALLALGLARGDLPLLWLVATAGLAAAFALRAALLPERAGAPLMTLPYAGLWTFALLCLFEYVVPYLT